MRGIREVLHARFGDHAYPMHTHGAWTLLIVDSGMVSYDLGRHSHGAMTSLVTLLPPDVPHDGRSVRPEGFRKRVLYLDRDLLDDTMIGPAVDHPGLADPALRAHLDRLHNALAVRTEDFEAESRLALIRERLAEHLRADRAERISSAGRIGPARPRPARAATWAGGLRDLLDDRIQQGITLAEAASLLHSQPSQLVRAFSRAYGLPPHLYLTGRRVELARHHLLAGTPVAESAVLAGFYDQSHLTRHFKRMLGVGPADYARR